MITQKVFINCVVVVSLVLASSNDLERTTSTIIDDISESRPWPTPTVSEEMSESKLSPTPTVSEEMSESIPSPTSTVTKPRPVPSSTISKTRPKTPSTVTESRPSPTSTVSEEMSESRSRPTSVVSRYLFITSSAARTLTLSSKSSASVSQELSTITPSPTTIVISTSSPGPNATDSKIPKCYTAVYLKVPMFINGSEPQFTQPCASENHRCVYLEATSKTPAPYLQSLIPNLPAALMHSVKKYSYIYHGCIEKSLCNRGIFCAYVNSMNKGLIQSCNATCCLGNYCNYGTKVSVCSKLNPCENNGTCVSVAKSSYCNCTTGFYGDRCQNLTIPPCSTNPCKAGKCEPRNNGFICRCPDNVHGPKCEYINYCVLKPCKNGGSCMANPKDPNTYICICPAKFTGPKCERADCFMKNMYAFGPSQNDTQMPESELYRIFCFQLNFPDVEFDFYGRSRKKLYICRNGLVHFDYPYVLNWPYTLKPGGWRPFYGVVAPFWSNIDIVDPFTRKSFYYKGTQFPPDPHSMSKVYYQWYNDASQSAVLKKASDDVKKYVNRKGYESFRATTVLVITWVNLYPFSSNTRSSSPYFSASNTFQVIFITDGLSTFAMYNYPCQGIQWVVRALGPNLERDWGRALNLPVIAWNSGSYRKNKQFNIPNSGKLAIRNIAQWTGNTKVIGRWFFPFNDGPTSESESQLKCKKWHKIQNENLVSYANNLLRWNQCPCSLFQAFFDPRFRFDWGYYLSRSNRLGTMCYKMVRPRIRSWISITNPDTGTSEVIYASLSRRCCYGIRSNNFGSLVVGPKNGGYLHVISYSRKSWLLSDEEAHKACCLDSNKCGLFYQKRPSSNCFGYRPPRRTWFWGDPHFVTMDSTNYTFNGLGEYIMLDADNGFFQLQARTKKAQGGDATAFAAGAAKENGTGIVEVRLNQNGTLEVLVDGVIIDVSNVTVNETKDVSNISFSREENNDITATFPSALAVSFGSTKGMMTIVMSGPEEFKNRTKGLLGVWNDKKEDDFTRRDGVIIPISSNDTTIHHEFGLNWQITAEESLFTYKEGESVDTFKNSSYVPLFADTLKFQNKTLENVARAICGTNVACLFDAAATKDPSIGKATLDTSSKLVNESEQLENFPPQFVNASESIKLTLNKKTTIVVAAEDKNGDSIKFVWPVIFGLQATQEKNVLTLEWTKNSTNKVNFSVVVKDPKDASSTWEPIIILCACQNGANCTNEENESGDRFQTLPCQCAGGYTGTFCESDINACEILGPPCYPGVKCTDLPAPADTKGFTCGSCPSGHTGNGESCADIDECAPEGNNSCQQICVNTPGSYRCECKTGFTLNSDNYTCSDVDECPKFVCQHKCINNIGSFKCLCNEGFKADSKDPRQCVPNQACNKTEEGCDQVCFVQNNTAKCSCNKGYELSTKDQKTCEDINECNSKPKLCSQICENKNGSYRCNCKPGYRLETDNQSCEDINECADQSLFNCSDPLNRCSNTPGSYKCLCPIGLQVRNGTCQESLPEPTLQPTTVITKPKTARTPREEERQQAILMAIRNVSRDEWSLKLETIFKNVLAELASDYCGRNTNQCGIGNPSQRKRRSNVAPAYNSSNVHIIPGYPKQNGSDLLIAFYILNPSGSSLSALPSIALLKIAIDGKFNISDAIGYEVRSFQKLISETKATTTATTTTAAAPPSETSDETWKWIIIGVACAVFIILAVGLSLICRRKMAKNKIDHSKGSSYGYNRGYALEDDDVELRKLRNVRYS